MTMKILKLTAVATLLLAVLPHSRSIAQTLLDILVCGTAVVVATQAFRAGNHIWAVGFSVIAVLFNPIMPLVFARRTFLWLDAACLMMFMLSLVALKGHPRLSIPSITDRTPGSELL